jgi:hypothetical protein
MRDFDAARHWATEEFRLVDLGDARRRRRLIAMGAAAARAPAARIADVFVSDAGRQGAYDFVESPHANIEAIVRGVGAACAQRCARSPFVFVPVDGTVLSMVDHAGTKGFGAVGAHATQACGIKVITAMALDPCGVPIGVAAQIYWRRPRRGPLTRRQQKQANRRRRTDEKEARHWVETIESTRKHLARVGAHAWFVIDREGDTAAILGVLGASGMRFTVRSSFDRVVRNDDGDIGKLRGQLQRAPLLGEFDVEIAAAAHRTARRARMQVRAITTTLHLAVRDTRYVQLLAVTAIRVREIDTAPANEPPLDWLLLTNHDVACVEDAQLVVFSYTTRWRIEEMHKAWKSGVCGVEQTQLRSHDAVVRWAIVLAAVAVRAERLKHLSRQQPDAPATVELSAHEIRALLLLKRRWKKRTETVPDAIPSMQQAVRWLADLGGYTGKSSGGPPGAITIGRGLAKVRAAAEVIEELDRPDR